jgi:DtxR family Mn-dependent transcriptional regulator
MNEKKIALQTEIRILTKQLFDGSMAVAYAGHPKEVLSKVITDKILVA